MTNVLIGLSTYSFSPLDDTAAAEALGSEGEGAVSFRRLGCCRNRGEPKSAVWAKDNSCCSHSFSADDVIIQRFAVVLSSSEILLK